MPTSPNALQYQTLVAAALQGLVLQIASKSLVLLTAAASLYRGKKALVRCPKESSLPSVTSHLMFSGPYRQES